MYCCSSWYTSTNNFHTCCIVPVIPSIAKVVVLKVNCKAKLSATVILLERTTVKLPAAPAVTLDTVTLLGIPTPVTACPFAIVPEATVSTIIVLSAVTAPFTRAVGPFAVAIVDVPFIFAVPCTSLNLSPVLVFV